MFWMAVFRRNWTLIKCGCGPSDCQYVSKFPSRSCSTPKPGLHDDKDHTAWSPISRYFSPLMPSICCSAFEKSSVRTAILNLAPSKHASIRPAAEIYRRPRDTAPYWFRNGHWKWWVFIMICISVICAISAFFNSFIRGILFRLSSGQWESINYVDKVCKISLLYTFVVGKCNKSNNTETRWVQEDNEIRSTQNEFSSRCSWISLFFPPTVCKSLWAVYNLCLVSVGSCSSKHLGK